MIFEEILSTTVLWQMSMGERAAVLYTIGCLPRRDIAIEVGSYRGGSLRVLAEHFRVVYSLDIDHSNLWIDRARYPNVRCIAGDSAATLPMILTELAGQHVNLILLDGSHEFLPVTADINNVLAYIPQSPMALLMHDSWHGPTRDAINQARWIDSPYVHLVESDFVPGDVAVDDVGARRIVGGLAVALMDRHERGMHEQLYTQSSQQTMFRSLQEALH